MAMKIDPEICTTCGDCKPVCPTGAVLRTKGVYSIDASLCTECDGDPECVAVCSADSIQPL